MSVTYDLTCWYLNARRIVELTGSVPAVPGSGMDEQLRKLASFRALKEAVVNWMGAAKPEPLGVMLAKGAPQVGKVFTCHSNFFFSGLGKVADALRKGKEPALAQAYTKLDDWQAGGRLKFAFHHEHLTSSSSWSELGGQRRAFVLGLITDTAGNEITAVPYVIAYIVDAGAGFGGYWQHYLEVHAPQINAFAKPLGDPSPRLTRASLELLRSVPEADIKTAFAALIGEPVVPKDWGGESSDLFSTRVEVNGARISTAFLLKGPSRFHPMTSADLGKNGDQIGRLFDEPADLLILQHCHEVTNAVRKQMRAYAQQMSNPRRFCIIDGYETLRILAANGLCGLNASALARGSAA